jgi:hypothetical protein
MMLLPATALPGTNLPGTPRSVPETDFLRLTYRADLHVVVGRWQRAVTEAELRQGYEAILRVAQEAGCPFWQLDVRGHDVPGEAALQWLVQAFLPHVATQMGQGVCLAYLHSPQQRRAEEPAPAGPIYLAFFSEEGPLTTWLTQCQHRSQLAQRSAGLMPPPLAA